MREIAFLSKFFSGKHFITTRSQVFMGDFLKIFKIFYRTSVNSSFQHNGPSYIPPCPSYYFEISISLKIEKKIFFLKTMWKVFQEQNIACWDILDLFFLLMPSAFFFFFFFSYAHGPPEALETLTVWSNFEFIAPRCSGFMLFFVEFKACVHYFLKTHDPSDLIT